MNPKKNRFASPFDDYRTPQTLAALLRSRASSLPGQVAYTFLADGETEQEKWTYADLDRRARAIASALRELAQPGQPALLLYPPGLEFIAGLFGCLYAGAIAAPAYPPDPSRIARTLPRLLAITNDLQPAVVLSTSRLLSAANSLPEMREFHPAGWLATDSINFEAEGETPQERSSSDVVFIQYTSGSTGSPKGVMLTNSNLLHNAALVYSAVEHGEGDSYVSWLPTFHDMGLMAGVLQPLFAGIPAVLISPAAFLEQPIRWLRAISDYRATTSGGPNFAYEMCVRKLTDEMCQGIDLTSWSVAFNGAEPIRKETIERFSDRFGAFGFRREVFYPCYGLAESTLMVSGGQKTSPPAYAAGQAAALDQNLVKASSKLPESARSFVSCGRPLGGQRVIIVDPNTETRSVPGVVGEIWVSGPSVARGYWGRDEESRRIFEARPRDSADGPFLRTGDLGFVKGGELFIAGRLKDLIIIRGLNHHPQDIELTVEKSHPALRPGCTAAFSVEDRGEETLAIVSEVDAPDSLDTEGHAAIIGAIRQAVAREHEIAVCDIALIKAGSLPKTTSGKIQRTACRTALLQQELKVVTRWRLPEAAPGFTSSRGAVPDIERDVEAWFAALLNSLGIDTAGFHGDEPLIRYGIDSLLAVELASKIHDETGAQVSPSSLLRGATASEIIRQVRETQRPSRLGEMNEASLAREVSASLCDSPPREFPLSYGQRGLWFLNQLAPGSSAYNIVRAVRIRGAVDAAALRIAFEILVDRHDALRATFHDNDGSPVQSISEETPVWFTFEDASALNEAEISARLIERANSAFDLAHGPLFRISLFRQCDDEHVMLFSVHHIVADFWSLAIIVDELGELYESAVSGKSARLSPVEARYSDFVDWQAEMIGGSEGLGHREYWHKKLAGELPVLSLTQNHPSLKVQTFRGASYLIEIEPGVTDALKSLAGSRSATPHAILLACLQALLHRYTGQSDIVIGCPAAGRAQARWRGVAGYFVNPVAVRTQVCARRSFEALLDESRLDLIEALEHQDYPFALLVEQLAPARDLSRPPIFQIMLVLEKSRRLDEKGLSAFALGEAGAFMKVGPLLLESMNLPIRSAQVDLSFVVAEVRDGLAVSIEYNSKLFDAPTVGRIAGHFRSLIRGVTEDAQSLAADLPLLSRAEHSQLLLEWNDIPEVRFERSGLHEDFEIQTRATPDRIAVFFEYDSISYEELNRQANQLARSLLTLGVGPETRVGICLNRSDKMIVALLGVLKAGGAYVPLDPKYPRERISFQLKDADVRILVAQQATLSAAEGAGVRILNIDDDRAATVAHASTDPAVKVSPSNLAYVIYTSGSTGRPKGVCIEHRNALTFLAWARDAFPQESFTGMLASTSICFDLSIFELFAPLSRGGSIVLVDNVLEVTHCPSAESITLINTVPSAAAALLRLGGLPKSAAIVNLAGEPLSAALVQQLYEHGSVERVINLYGPSEDTTYSTFEVIERSSTDAPAIGRPIANTRVYILDSNLCPVPAWLTGELVISGAGLARGYLNRPELTAEKFLPDPFALDAGSRMYRTGDGSRRREDGRIQFQGRADQQIKLRGFRIELEEIEHLMRSARSVIDAACKVIEDSAGEKQLVAYAAVDGASDKQFGTTIKSFLRQRLPEYMIPATVVVMESLPLTPNGKIDRKALPAPASNGGGHKTSLARPLSLPEELLAGIWSDLLRLEHVDRRDNFFELGGHSLVATGVTSHVRRVFGVDLPLQAIFESPVLFEQAAAIELLLRGPSPRGEPPPTTASHRRTLPLSYAQRRLWLIDQMQPGDHAYNIPAVIRLDGSLNPEVLHSAINEVVRRHESMRTSFPYSGVHPVQLVAERLDAVIPLIDLSGLASSDRAAAAMTLATEQAQTSFDLSALPLIRFGLLKLSDSEHLLVMVMHHIISDGWSLGVLVKELAALHDAATLGRPSELAELALQYGDYSLWQHEWLEQRLAADLDYWKEKLAGAPVTELPTDYPRPAVPSQRGAGAGFELDQLLCARLNDVARISNATLFMVLMSAFHALLSRYTGENDITIGTPIANRNRAELEPLIGFFVNTLPLRLKGNAGETFQDRVAAMKETALDAYAHQDAPFEKIVEAVQPARMHGSQPLFRTMLTLQNAPLPELRLRGLTLRRLETESASSKFEITFSLEESERRLKGTVEYSTDLFNHSTIDRMIGHFQTLLEAVVSSPQAVVDEIDLMRPAERNQVLEGWNQTDRDFGDAALLHQLFEAQADKTPDRIAVTTSDCSLTYMSLSVRADQIGRRLRSLGIGPDAITGLFAERSLEMVIGMIGILKAGSAYLPIDPSLPAERIRFIVEDAGVGVVVTQEELAEALPSGQSIVTLSKNGSTDVISGEAPVHSVSGAVQDNLAYVLYTSGSTGRPKGIGVTHRSIHNHMRWFVEDCPLCEDDRVLQKTAFGFDASVWEFFAPLMTGAELIMASPGGQKDAQYLSRVMAEQSITIAQFVPSMLRLVVEESAFAECNTLKVVYCGGEPLTADLQANFHARCAAELRNLYGPTEATIDTISWRCDRRGESAPIPIGRPVSNARAYILDRLLQPVPTGVVGELCLGGECLARGYIGRSELTAAAFIPNSFDGEGSRLYRTGDLTRFLADGTIQYLGRLDQQLKIRGFRVEIEEIEAAITRHPEIRDAAVIARERRPGQIALAAYLTPIGDEPPDAAALRQFLKRDLPDYMLPDVFVRLKSLPRTVNGKIDRRALPAPSWERDPSIPVAEPETPTQRLIAETLAALLGIERVGIAENFFELGGHSLIAAQLATRLRESLRVDVTIRSILERPTVARLSDHIDQMTESSGLAIRFSGAAPIPRAHRTPAGPDATLLPMSYAQQRLWLIHQIDPSNPSYNMPAVVRLTGDLNVEALRDSINDVIARHEALRTSFPSLSTQPAQVISGTLKIEMPSVDLSGHPETLRESEAMKLASDEASRGFDLAQAPLFRFTLIKLSHTHHLLVMVMHHIISDGWSMGVLVRELCALYDARVNKTRADLAELAIQYGDYSVWQRDWLRGERLERELDYWRRELEGAPTHIDLPTDRLHPAAMGHRGATLNLVLNSRLSSELSRLAKSRNATPFMVLLAAFYTLLARYSGQQDIVIGTPVANRDLAEIEPLIGFFVNTLPIRIKAAHRDTFGVLLERVKSTTLAAYTHKEAPFEKIMEALRPTRGTSGHPLFQVMFALQNTPMPALRLSGLDVDVEYVDSGTAKFDLSVLMTAAEDRLEAIFEYSTELFDRPTISRLASHFEQLLAEIIKDPAQPISDLQILTPEELALFYEHESPANSDDRVRTRGRLFVLDANLQPTPAGVIGDLYSEGAILLGESLNKDDGTDDGTDEMLIPDSAAGIPSGRLHRTGDLARRLPDGTIELVNPFDATARVRGLRVWPTRIEAVLSKHPSVRQAAAAISSPETLTAYVVAQQHHGLAVNELRSYLESTLPAHMIPSAFVFLESLPLTEAGDLDRNRLPAPGADDEENLGAQESAGAIETELQVIWSKVLGVDRVKQYDNFFDLGGHSLLATQLISEIREALDIDVPLRKVFESPTIRGLTEYIRQEQRDGINSGRTKWEARPSKTSRTADDTVEAPAIWPNSERRQWALSFSQQRIWLLSQLDPITPAHNISRVLALEGALDINALRQSLNEIVRRHETLRSGFGWSVAGPVQTIAAEIEVQLPLTDLSTESAARDIDSAARGIIDAETTKPFNLGSPPLLRAGVVKLADDRHNLILTMHRIISDEWSLDVLTHELSEIYGALADNKPSPLTSLPIQYRDFAVWQREWVRDGAGAQVQYWKEELEGIARLDLPADRPRPQVTSYQGRRERLDLGVSLAQSVKQMCRREGLTPRILALAAFKVLLNRYTGQEDIAVGVLAANRDRDETAALIGPLANTLVMRSRLTPRDPMREFIQRERQLSIRAHLNQDVPFEKLIEDLEPGGDLGRSGLSRVRFEQHRTPVLLPDWGAVRVTRIDHQQSCSRFDLALSILETDETLIAEIEFSSDLFDLERIQRMLVHYGNLLESITRNPDQRAGEIEFLSDAERRQLLVDWNDTRREYPECGIATLFEEQAAMRSDKVALVFEALPSPAAFITYKELDRRSNHTANRLREGGAGIETPVGVCAERSIELMIALLGILKAGCVYVPFDPREPEQRLAFMLDDTRTEIVLTQHEFKEEVGRAAPSVLSLDIEAADLDDADLDDAHSRLRRVEPEHLAYVMYTSGSTGAPKGVAVTHRAVARLVKNPGYASLSADDVFLQLAPISFDASTLEIWGSLLNGGTLVVMPPHQPSTFELGRALARHQITTLWLTAGLFHLMVDENPEALRGVRQLLAGGDVLSVPHVKRYLDGPHEGVLINGYGPTENTTFTCCQEVTGSLDLDISVPIGRPISNTQVYVSDRRFNHVPAGVTGEILIAGYGLARCYQNRADLTAERFIPDPFSKTEGGRVYRSGDLGRHLDDGAIRFEGRVDRQLKLRGFRIEIDGIENLIRSHESVAEAACKVFEDASGEKQLVAFVALKGGVNGSAEEAIKTYLRKRVPDYMVPSLVMRMAALPLTRNGKIDRDGLQYPGSRSRSREYVAPRTATEESIARIWRELLGVDSVGVQENFFELGGHSLMAARVVSKVRESFGIEISLRTLFESPTVAEFSERLDASRAETSASLPPPLAPVSIDQYRAVVVEGSITIPDALKRRVLGTE